jgi:hypothetical protein
MAVLLPLPLLLFNPTAAAFFKIQISLEVTFLIQVSPLQTLKNAVMHA